MTEQIGQKLTTVISAAVTAPVYYSEAETESYPYIVYDQTVTPSSTKDGIYKLTSSAQVNVVSDSFDEADEIASSVISAVASGINDDQFHSFLSQTSKECLEGIWTIQIIFAIKQLS